MSNAFIIRAGNITKNYVDTNLETKVDKITGKGLSTNDYDNTAKNAVESLGTASICNTGTNLGNVPILNQNGKLENSTIPAVAITDTFTATNQSEMLALNAQKGDVCIRTDESKTYILQVEPPTELSNWIELQTPTDLVQSVNGKVGVVVLNSTDVGAVASNESIPGNTKCKITYDSKGLVTAGENLSSMDIPDISETYETKSNKSDSFTTSSSTTYASTKAVVDGLATKAQKAIYTATIGTNWIQGVNNEYTQDIAVLGVLATDTPSIDIVLDENIITAKSQLDAWSYISRITTNNGTLIVTCYDSAPEIPIPIQILCVR